MLANFFFFLHENIDYLFIVFLLMAPLCQLKKIITNQSSQNVSKAAWIFFLLMGIIALGNQMINGYQDRAPQIIMGIFIIENISVICYIQKYKNEKL